MPDSDVLKKEKEAQTIGERNCWWEHNCLLVKMYNH